MAKRFLTFFRFLLVLVLFSLCIPKTTFAMSDVRDTPTIKKTNYENEIFYRAEEESYAGEMEILIDEEHFPDNEFRSYRVY